MWLVVVRKLGGSEFDDQEQQSIILIARAPIRSLWGR